MKPQRFFSRANANDQLQHLFEDSDKYVYFIEHGETHLWWSKFEDWTNDPIKALSFPNKYKALIEGSRLKLYPVIVTEHEFVGEVSKPEVEEDAAWRYVISLLKEGYSERTFIKHIKTKFTISRKQ